MSDNALRKQLVIMLTEPNAHNTFDKIVDGFPAEHYGTLIEGTAHTVWQLLEHLRLCQWDILEFSRDPNHVSPSFPDGYWPEKPAPSNNEDWDKSVSDFRHDLKEMVGLITDESNDLYLKIPHGDGQTLLREAFVLAKHNSYHLGQMAMIKKAVMKL
jgi:hypothetical protein